jgi:hypothetical protein
MYLRNSRTRELFPLAKYYPNTGWYPIELTAGSLAEKMNDFFDHNRDTPSMWGDEDYEIVYESKDEPKRKIMEELVTSLRKEDL